MPKTVFQRVIFTSIGVLFMATTMAFFNKFFVYKELSWELLKQVGIAFLEKAPLAFILQFFVVQKIAAKLSSKYPSDNKLVSRVIRVGFTALIMAPIMCLYSNIINWIQFHWTFKEFITSFISKLPINWLFAFFIQVLILKPLIEIIFKAIFKKKLSEEKNQEKVNA